MTIPFTYLGILVGGSHKRREFWIEMIGKIHKKLSRWKGRAISLDGRVYSDKVGIIYFAFIIKVYLSNATRGEEGSD